MICLWTQYCQTSGFLRDPPPKPLTIHILTRKPAEQSVASVVHREPVIECSVRMLFGEGQTSSVLSACLSQILFCAKPVIGLESMLTSRD